MLVDLALYYEKTRLFYGVLQRRYAFPDSSIRSNVLQERVNITVKTLAETGCVCKVEREKVVWYWLKDIAECVEKLPEISSDPKCCSECG